MGTNMVRTALGRSLLWLATGGVLAPVLAQSPRGSTLEGRVTEAGRDLPLAGVQVIVAGQRVAITGDDGRYVMDGLPVGERQVTFRWIGYAPRRLAVTLATEAARTLDVALERNPQLLGEVSVIGVSRTPERIVEAPAAVVVAEPARVREMAATGQVPLLVGDLTGVHIAQSGLYDFNLNTRGFNGALNRRTLVLIDGRDVSIPILGNQDWADLSVMEEGTAVEMVRGPGSALYGANAFSGVLAIRTPSVRESRGARLSLTTGELSTRRVDGRYGYVAPDYRWGVRLSGGFQQSQTWDRSRTNTGNAAREYEAAGFSSGVVHPPAPGYDLRALEGQVKSGAFGLPGSASGTADPVQTWYGSARADWYPANGSVLTAEGGMSRVENTVIATSAGRSQVTQADRPWARVAWNADAFSVFGYYTGRDGEQFSLATGTRAVDKAGTMQLEGQFNRSFAGTRGRLVAGASVRRQTVDSRGTILSAEDDGRADRFYALFQQVDFELTPAVKLIAASRWDAGTLYDAVFSPKLGVVVMPTKDQTVRLTWNRGFLTPSSFQRFLFFPAAPPLDLRALEGGLRASPLGPALAGVPSGALFDNSAAVPVLALGNRTLQPEDVTGMELGYKGQIGRVFLTVDAYYSDIKDFSTGLLAGVNPAYAPWTAPAAVPEVARAGLEAAVRGTMGAGFSRLPGSGTSAYALSMGNAGRAKEYGVEAGIAVQVNSALRFDANFASYGFSLDHESFYPSDTVEANTPPHTANVAAVYQANNGARARLGVRWEDGFKFRSGTWVGDLPSSRSVDLNLTYPLGHRLTATLAGTNVLDESRVHLMGGSLIGRRVLVTLGWSQ